MQLISLIVSQMTVWIGHEGGICEFYEEESIWPRNPFAEMPIDTARHTLVGPMNMQRL